MAKQIKTCDNCRRLDDEYCGPWAACYDDESKPNWKSKRGRKQGSKFKQGSKTPGAHKLPIGEKKQHLNLHVKGKYIKAWGGKEKAQKEAINHLETKSK